MLVEDRHIRQSAVLCHLRISNKHQHETLDVQLLRETAEWRARREDSRESSSAAFQFQISVRFPSPSEAVHSKSADEATVEISYLAHLCCHCAGPGCLNLFSGCEKFHCRSQDRRRGNNWSCPQIFLHTSRSTMLWQRVISRSPERHNLSSSAVHGDPQRED